MINGRNSRHSRRTAAIAGDLMLAPMVAMMRLPMMAAETRGANPWRSESARAVAEKSDALAEGVIAAQMSLIQSASRFWPEFLSGRTPSILNGVAVERSVQAALKPSSRRVKANFHRLSAKD